MQPARFHQVGGKDDFVLISTRQPSANNSDFDFDVIENPAEKVEFDPTQSHLIGFAINDQSHERFKARTLGRSVVNDAKLISETFVQIGALPPRNAIVHEAKEAVNNCTFEGMKRCFVQTARLVGEDGLFVFHFSGHGIRVRDDQWGLAPSDFDYTESTYVTAKVLNDWLTEADCKAKHVLFTLDCCYAGGVAQSLMSTEVSHRSLFVMSSCTADETSYAVGTLDHSVFSYFLSDAMKRCANAGRETKQGLTFFIELQKIFAECLFCSEALSSLLVKYVDGTLHPAEIHPNMQTFGPPSIRSFSVTGTDETDSSNIGRFDYVIRHYDRQSIQPLDRDSEKWLSSLCQPEGPLSKLQSRGLLMRKEVLLTALSSMMYSVGAYQLHRNPANVCMVNTFITAYLNVVSVIDFHYSKGDFSAFHFLIALGYYMEVLKKNSHPYDPLRGLYTTICRETNQLEDSTDGPESKLPDIPPITKWEAL